MWNSPPALASCLTGTGAKQPGCLPSFHRAARRWLVERTGHRRRRDGLRAGGASEGRARRVQVADGEVDVTLVLSIGDTVEEVHLALAYLCTRWHGYADRVPPEVKIGTIRVRMATMDV